MAKTDAAALRGMSDAELREAEKQLREQLFKLRWQASTGNVENPNKIREVRKAIARHLTVLGERERAAGQAGGGR